MPTETLKVQLTVSVKDKFGKEISRRCKDKDLVLNNFRDLILFGLMGKGNEVDNIVAVSLIEEESTSKSFNTYYPLDQGAQTYVFNRGYNESQRKIAVGTGTTAPARTDYMLESKTEETESVSVTSASNYVSFTAAITLVTGADITEAGYFLKIYSRASVNVYWVMLLHDTFTAVTVPDAGTITISYKITF